MVVGLNRKQLKGAMVARLADARQPQHHRLRPRRRKARAGHRHEPEARRRRPDRSRPVARQQASSLRLMRAGRRSRHQCPSSLAGSMPARSRPASRSAIGTPSTTKSGAISASGTSTKARSPIRGCGSVRRSSAIDCAARDRARRDRSCAVPSAPAAPASSSRSVVEAEIEKRMGGQRRLDRRAGIEEEGLVGDAPGRRAVEPRDGDDVGVVPRIDRRSAWRMLARGSPRLPPSPSSARAPHQTSPAMAAAHRVGDGERVAVGRGRCGRGRCRRPARAAGRSSPPSRRRGSGSSRPSEPRTKRLRDVPTRIGKPSAQDLVEPRHQAHVLRPVLGEAEAGVEDDRLARDARARPRSPASAAGTGTGPRSRPAAAPARGPCA